MTLLDSSAWIEFFRKSGSPVHRAVRSALQEGAQLAWTDMVALEVLAGARAEAERDRVRRLIYGQDYLAVSAPADYESAAELFRACCRGGETPRSLVDCLIAIVAIRNEAELLCCDADFQVIARHSPLRLAAASTSTPV